MSPIGAIGVRMLLALLLMVSGCAAPPDVLGCERSTAEDCQAAFELAYERARGHPPDTVAGASVEHVSCDQISGFAETGYSAASTCWLVTFDAADGRRMEIPVIRQPGGRMTIPWF